MKIVIYIAGYI